MGVAVAAGDWMLRSMTGYGDAQLLHEGHAYHLEIRSVNNRYLKALVALPEEFAFLEADTERLVRQRLSRGSVTVRLHVRDLTAAAAQELNVAAMRTYLEQLRGIGAGEPGVTIDLATLANLPGVCQARELTEVERERCWQIVQRLLDQALAQLMAMRAAEGRSLATDLQRQCELMRGHLRAVRERAPLVVAEYRRRLAERVHELLAGSNATLAEADLLKEVSIYAQRSDITEELVRLEAHLAQFQTVAAGEQAAGRKLEFIAQEMLREANTLGSKAADAEIAREIIEIKAAIDRIKEQVQNVE